MFTNDRPPTLIERLDGHPLLRARVESLLAVGEDAAGDCEKADAAERRMIEELRQMGHEALTVWAERGVEKQVVLAQAEPDWRPGGKKNCIGTQPLVRLRSWNRSGGTGRASSGPSAPWRA